MFFNIQSCIVKCKRNYKFLFEPDCERQKFYNIDLKASPSTATTIHKL